MKEGPGKQLRTALQGVAASNFALHIVEEAHCIFVEEVDGLRNSSATNVL